jgi:hypothetical protein
MLLGFAAVVVATWWIRDRSGPDLHVALLLVIDALYLGATWGSRR